VKVVARLRINYGAKQSFSSIADNLGFWPFISAAEDGSDRSDKYRVRHKKDLLEDVLEATVGCTEQILDQAYRPGVGYAIVYDILADIFNEMTISLKYTDLYDAKTRMKEIFDMFGKQIGTFKFIDTRDERVATSRLYRVPPGSRRNPLSTLHDGIRIMRPNNGWDLIGSGTGSKKSDSQQRASESGIKTLNSHGYIKPVPLEYLLFCK
jgi:dsRNA-specific ribonuclease